MVLEAVGALGCTRVPSLLRNFHKNVEKEKKRKKNKHTNIFHLVYENLITRRILYLGEKFSKLRYLRMKHVDRRHSEKLKYHFVK